MGRIVCFHTCTMFAVRCAADILAFDGYNIGCDVAGVHAQLGTFTFGLYCYTFGTVYCLCGAWLHCACCKPRDCICVMFASGAFAARLLRWSLRVTVVGPSWCGCPLPSCCAAVRVRCAAARWLCFRHAGLHPCAAFLASFCFGGVVALATVVWLCCCPTVSFVVLVRCRWPSRLGSAAGLCGGPGAGGCRVMQLGCHGRLVVAWWVGLPTQ